MHGMNRACLNLLTVLIFLSAVFAADDKQTTDALIQKAVSASNLLRGDVPFSMHASFEVLDLKGKPKGEYDLIFASTREWRDTVRTTKYAEETFVTNGQMMRVRPANYEPVPMLALRAAIDLGREFQGTPNKNLEKVWRESANGISAACALYKHGLQVIELCVDSATGNLIRVKGSGYETALSSHLQYGSKSVAGEARVKWYGKPVLTVSIMSLKPVAVSNSVSVPADANPVPYCASPQFTLPELSANGKVPPRYPPEARQSHTEGSVYLSMTIRSDGSVKQVEVLETGGRLLDEASIEAVRRWRYVPASCDGKSMDYESSVRISYSMGGF
jgi:TonB family protein